MSPKEIWYVKSWQVLPDKVEEHETLQQSIWTASLERFPEMNGKLRYFIEKDGSKEVRHIVFTGFSELEQYQSIEKMSDEDPYLAGLFERFYPLTVPGSAKKLVWVDGVTWEEEQMPKVKVNDIEMYYEVHGEGTPFVLITGYGGTSQGTKYFLDVPKFSKYHQCILVDNRGIGQSATSEGPYSMKIMASDVAELLDALEIPEAHILGGSMGGMIAQEIALGYPDKVTSLILVCTSPGGRKVWEIPGQLQAFYQMSWNFDPPEGISDDELLEVDLGMCYSDDYVEKNRSRFSYTKVTDPIVVETLRKQYDAFVKHDTYDRLHMIKQPTLILHGSLDGLTFPEGALMLDERIPDSRLVMFEGLKHSFLVEERDKFTRIVLDFLREVDDDAR